MVDDSAEFTLSIGAVSRATGIPANTLRTWERRYGFPKPVRTEGGQRAYLASIVPHLQQVAQALDQGLRPRDALTANRGQLAEWCGTAATEVPETEVGQMLIAVRRLDRLGLDRMLRVGWARHGAVAFMDGVLGPLLHLIGEEWASGDLAVFQEHHATEIIRAFLTGMWVPLADSAKGGLVLCATLPGEHHDLGLHFATTTLTVAGRRVHFLGPNTPVDDLIEHVNSEDICTMLLSSSAAADPVAVEEALVRIVTELPELEIVIGGAGAPEVPGVQRLTSCEALWLWARG